MKNGNATGLNGQPLLDDLAAALGLGCASPTTPAALRWPKRRTGPGAVVFGVILGTGVGSGVAVDRRVLPGANAIAGEWGHTPLPYFRTDPATTAVDERLPDRPCY